MSREERITVLSVFAAIFLIIAGGLADYGLEYTPWSCFGIALCIALGILNVLCGAE